MQNIQKVLIVVDYQYDFVSGALPVQDADKIANNIQSQINDMSYDAIIYTLDTHVADAYFQSEEGKMFPIHCEFNTPGWDFYKIKPRNREISTIINEGVFETPKDFSIEDEYVFMKDKFSIWEGNSNYSNWFRNTFDKDVEITIVGVATDFCVFYNAMGYRRYGYQNISIISNAVMGLNIEGSLDKAIFEMKTADITFKEV